ncbi:hypothetical protein KEH56_35245 [Burkholderia cenocepacia]|uniref:hypothetical protein n=1 Tax=Burkholderia cenocepacia TaxID=95486 RepID=UPI001BA7DF4F|nr:hypothetical protein [Burkholderia cenocepacia]QUN44445.1 hypothetical protein KEH56_35245 [Burkholderia cenocepacia]
MTFLAFSVRPSVVIPDHRPLYKIVQVLLVLYLASNGKKSSMVRLQMFNWALKSSARRDKLAAAAQSGALDFPAWGFDPALDAAVALAKADGLLEATTTGVKLTEKGAQFCALATREEST